jgi:flavodoxin
MKKRGVSILLLLMLFILAACTNQPGNTPAATLESTPEIQDDISDAEEPTDTAIGSETTAGESKILIAYFSSAGNIVTDEEPRGNVGHGNTKTIADFIQGQVGGDLFFIETVEKYPANYDDTIDVAMQEQRTNARPALASEVENMDDYDVIFIGFPIWWGTMPQPVFTFLDDYDFSGKTVIPFCTHEGSGFGRSTGDLESSLPDSTLLKGFSVRGSSASNAVDDVTQWLSELNLPE